MTLPRLHLITDDEVLTGNHFLPLALELLALGGPALALHLRGHGLAGGRLFEIAREVVPAAALSGAMIVINDRTDVALAAAATGTDVRLGVQLGRRSLPVPVARELLGTTRQIGYSAHAVDEAVRAVEHGADYILIGTIHASASHPGAGGAGPELVSATVMAVADPAIAIGGVTPDRVPGLLAAGAYGVAVLGGIWRDRFPQVAMERYLAALART
jgi:thiamine-phosphate diphosphorylase